MEMMSVYSKLPEILLNLAGHGRSGVFRAQKDSAKRQLVLIEGKIAFAESNQPDEHLARIMIALGYLEQSDLREVTAHMKNGKNSEEAVRNVYGSREEPVNKAIREQAVIVAASMLGWGSFDMRFFPGENLINGRTCLWLDMHEMLVLSARRAASKQLVTVPADFFKGMIVSNMDLKNTGTVFPLNESEHFALTRAHDTISAGELIQLIPESDTSAEEVLRGLFVLGLVKMVADEEVPSAAAQEPTVSGNYRLEIENMMVSFQNGNLYKILSVEKNAGQDEIQDAYYKLAKRYHPDLFQSDEFSDDIRSRAELIFSYINKAYSTLRDPSLRERYDEERRTHDSHGAPGISKTSSGSDEAKAIEALYRLGRQSLTKGEFEKAVKELKSCVHLRPENATYNYWLGLAESEISRLHKNAEQHFLKAIELEPVSPAGYVALVKLYRKVGLQSKASRMLKQLLRWDPDNPEAKKILENMEES